MCFSPEADLVGGVVVGAIGLDVLVHLRGRREFKALAALPLLFAVHQVVESLVWWGATGSIPHTVGTAALWVYLLFAFVVLPTYVPWATWCIEPPGPRRRLMASIAFVGVAVSVVLLTSMLIGPVRADAREFSVAYSTSLDAWVAIVALYVFVTCGAFICSGEPVIVWFGVVNLIAVAVIATLTVDGFASVWCAWAAVSSAAFAFYLRREAPELFEPASSHPAP